MKIAYIMRGVPGSGKSTIARELVGNDGAIHSTDDYFYVDGVYQYQPSDLPRHHDRNYQAFCESLKMGIPVVICDNTNVKQFEYERYVKAAEEKGYYVAYVVLPHPDPKAAASRNIHGVAEHAIRQMIDEWE